MPTRTSGALRISTEKFSPELRAALMHFGDTYVRARGREKTEVSPSGIECKLLVTDPPELGERYREAREALLAQNFRKELPILDEIDYQRRGEQISKALGRHATQDEHEEELGAALEDIRQIEDKLAAVGLRMKIDSQPRKIFKVGD